MLDATGLRLVATCARGLEEVVAAELDALGAAGVVAGRGMVSCTGPVALLCRANLWLRAAMRVVVGIGDGPVAGRDDLYRLAVGLEWERLLDPSTSFAVEAVGRHPAFPDHRFAALVVKDAVADRLRRRFGRRPDVDRRNPDLKIHLHLGSRRASLALDSSGEPLSHRGYRPRGGPAPLAESLAAGILELAGYDGTQTLADPMCGTGTLAAEAALIATRTAPGRRRSFAFERWPSVDPVVIAAERERATAAVRRAPAPILASDSDPRAVAASSRNLAEAGVASAVRLERRDVRELALEPGAMVVSNPPYGHRIGEVGELAELYRELGRALKAGAAGCVAWLLIGEPALSRELGLKASRKIPLYNGPIECRLLRYELRAPPG